MRVAISSSLGVDRLADAVLVLTYKARVPVLKHQLLVFRMLFSSLLVSDHSLFSVITTLYLTPRVNKASTAYISRLVFLSYNKDIIFPTQSMFLDSLFALINGPISTFKSDIFQWPAKKSDLLLLFDLGLERSIFKKMVFSLLWTF